ncbi:MAG: transcription elongation factor GreA [Bacteroidales bacterium]|nr:transcription elongation factor GreA [Bacteroidales bacterium]MBQ3576566.1 transcription elongation factor GreA [Coprobacter sp.]MBR5324350.1 transcription elongation factor GreA [Muribaculaceae bacterium]
MAVVYLTDEGYHKMMDEINYLESVERPRISAQIAEARDKGDLSENAEYDAAKEAQGLLEMKIAQLKSQVANARIISDANLNTHTVQMLNKVKIKNCQNGAVMEYMLVADSEANLAERKISVSTPIAQGLLGHHVGDVVEVKVPAGLMKFEIVEILI